MSLHTIAHDHRLLTTLRLSVSSVRPLPATCSHRGSHPSTQITQQCLPWLHVAGRGRCIRVRDSAAEDARFDHGAGQPAPVDGLQLPLTSSDTTSPGSTADTPASSEAQVQQHEAGAGYLPVVPWGVGKIAQVMLLWLIAYVIVGQVAVPILMALLGLDRELLSIRGHAILHLSLDVFQLGVTLLILQRCLGKFKLQQLGIFPVKFRGSWPLLVLAFCMLFPVVDWLAQQSVTWFPTEGDQWANQMEHNLSLGDWITNVAYFCLVSICAPIWEEAIFRGFLLASLARYMPVYAAMVSSSLLFAMCHFRLQTFLPLLLLGIIFSAIFLLSRNLLPPIILHSLWNIYVLVNLLFRPA